MDRETARKEIRGEWRFILDTLTGKAKARANGEPSYICPLCGHGRHGEGLTFDPKSADKNSLHCFDCGFYGDVIDLVQKLYGYDYNEAFNELAKDLQITIDEEQPNKGKTPAQNSETITKDISLNSNDKAREMGDFKPLKEENKADYTEYYRKCSDLLINSPVAIEYLTGRGISIETARAYWIGYDPAADPAQSGHESPRIILPTSPQHYVARSIDNTIAKQYRKMNVKGSAPAIFNVKSLYTQDVQEVFVCEGIFDALSIIEIGGDAIALNGTANAEALIQKLSKDRTKATLILCLDNDDPGRRASEVLTNGLKHLNIGFIKADICGCYKDPNEALTSDRNFFLKAIKQAKWKASKPDNTQYYINAIMGKDLERFKNEIKTGFYNLDKEAGGLYPGLYIMAAISSLGKTTFVLQLADQLAAAGSDVLFFSLEQSRLELVTKSIARKSAQINIDTARSSLAIRKGDIPQSIQEAVKQYSAEVQDRISIIEGNFNCDISFIGDYIREYIRKNGARPVVIVDYLQILEPAKDERGRSKSAKESVDATVTELKRISREMDLTIIAISSVNRANYLTPIDFESLKESGGIEFTADVVWGLQLQCLNDPIFDKANNIKERREKVNAAKAETPRKIELKCLKNRYGIASYSCYFDYYPAFDLFKPTGNPGATEQPKKPRIII